MKFLHKLIYLSGLFGLLAATSDHSLKPVAPVQVKCGGRTWTDGEFLGNFQGNAVHTIIFENRIYIRYAGRGGDEADKLRAFDNTAVLFSLDTGLFPLSGNGDYVVSHCVNAEDPSTVKEKYLGANTGDAIKCGDLSMVNNSLLGAYVGGDGVKTFQYVRIKDNILRINFQRDGSGRDYEAFSMGLIEETIQRQRGSYMGTGYENLTYPMVKGCFWESPPKYPDEIITPTQPCASGPTLQTISDISKTGLTFTFTGTNIPKVVWRIKSNSSTVQSGTTGSLSGSTTVNLTFGSLNAGSYTLEIEGGDCSSSVSSKTFTVTDPVVTIPDCTSGPTITTIKNITATSLTVDISGVAIPNITWQIKNGGTVLAGSKTTNLNNSIALTFGSLANGTYTLEIQGGDCKSSVNSKTFTVSIAPGQCQAGPNLLEIASVTDHGLDFQFHGNGVFKINWKIYKGSEEMRSNSVDPQSSRPSISYETLPTGVYTLEIQGGSCVSTPSSMAFGVNVALPIYIASFDASVVKKGIELSWKVVEEKNGEGFEVIRFDDKMQTREVIGTVPLTEQRLGMYKFLDEKPLTGINYYQLKQVDKDGSFINSKIVAVKYDQIFEALIAPNPARDNVSVQFTARAAGESHIDVYNLSGIKLSTTPIKIKEGANSYPVNVGKLTSGMYILKVAHGDDDTNLRFIKSN